MAPDSAEWGWGKFFGHTLLVAPFLCLLSMILVMVGMQRLYLPVVITEGFAWYGLFFFVHEMPWILLISALVPYVAVRRKMSRRRAAQAWLIVAPTLTLAWCTADILWIYGS